MTEPRENNLVGGIDKLKKKVEATRAAVSQPGHEEKTRFSFLQSPDCEKNLRKFIDSNLVSIIRCTESGQMIEANEAAAKMLGFTMEELNQSSVQAASFTPPEYEALDQAAMEQVLDTGRATAWEKELIRKDGTRAKALVAGLTSSGPDNELLAFLIDITHKKKVVAELEASEKQFKLLAEAIPQLVWVCDHEGKTSYLNQRFYDVTGLNKEDEDGFLWLSAIHPADRKRLLTRARQAVKAMVPFENRVRFLAKDGGARWHIVRALPIEDDGPLIKWFGTATDIDSKVRLQEKMSKREKHFRTLANAIPQIVWTADFRGEIDFFNHRWFEYTGLTLDESRNDGWQFLIHPDDRKKYIREWRSALATGDSYEMEFRLRRSPAAQSDDEEDPYRWHLGRAVALRNQDGSIRQWFATWTEIESHMNKEET